MLKRKMKKKMNKSIVLCDNKFMMIPAVMLGFMFLVYILG